MLAQTHAHNDNVKVSAIIDRSLFSFFSQKLMEISKRLELALSPLDTNSFC